jgi:hypothetical protein
VEKVGLPQKVTDLLNPASKDVAVEKVGLPQKVTYLLNPASKDVAVEKVGLPQKVTGVRTSHVTTNLSQTVYRLTRNEAQVTKQHNSDEEIYFQYYELISPPSKF